MQTENRGIYIVTLFAIIIMVVVGATAVGQGTLVTVAGRELSGTISGIDTVVRLNVVPAAGPITVFDIPRNAIRQITIDFPRMIVETSTRVYIGPFSDFTGISQIVDIHYGSGTTSIPIAGVRAIALNGNPVRPVPREWLGDQFLTQPTIKITAAPGASTSTATAASPAPATEHPINWAKINPSPALPPPESTGTPWWVGILVAAGLAGLVYFSLTSLKL